MTDSVQIWKPGFRILDDSGDPVAGGKIKFFDAGTSNPRTVYTDKGLSSNASTVITADSSGVPQVTSVDVVAYTTTADYKVVITDASDNVLITVDNLAGALDTSNYLTTASPLTMAVQGKTSNYTVTSGDLGGVINCDASGGAFTVTLLAAATAGDGATITIRKTDTSSNAVSIDPNGSETINGTLTVNLTTQHQSGMLVCDGSNWHVMGAVGSGESSHEEGTSASYQTLSTIMPLDDTIPQNTEGDEILTVAITPTSSDAEVVISVSLFCTANANEQAQFALFVDSTVDAFHAVTTDIVNGDYQTVSFMHVHAPATTSAVTYKLRGGPASANNVYVNGSTSARLFGGVASVEMLVREI